MITLVLVILSIFVIACSVWNVVVKDELDEREEELDKYSVYLDERANMLARWEQELRDLSDKLD